LFFCARTATRAISTSLHDALPISAKRQLATGRPRRLTAESLSPPPSAAPGVPRHRRVRSVRGTKPARWPARHATRPEPEARALRSEEHTSELQSRENLVCRLLLEK